MFESSPALCDVLLATHAGVMTIRLNRPEAHNALNETLLEKLRVAVDASVVSDCVNDICVCGNEAAFMLGADLPYFLRAVLSGDLDRVLRFTHTAHEVQAKLAYSPRRTVAWVQGVAYGAGLELALSCQRVVASPAAKFSLPETGLGIYPGMGGTQRLPRRIGTGLAKWMIYTGAVVPAAQALEIGLVDEINPSATCAAEAVSSPMTSRPSYSAHFASLAAFFNTHSVAELCDPAFALPAEPHLARSVVQVRSKGPVALRLAEQIIDAGSQMPLCDAIELEFAHLREVFSTADARTGLLTLAKGRPMFTGC